MNPDGDSQREERPELPVCITAVKPQKKRRDRFSLYSGKDFVMGVSGEILTRFGLRKGVELTVDLYEQLRHEEERHVIQNALLRLLGRRSHSSVELKRKALKKGFPLHSVERVLEYLEERGFLDDQKFARKFASDKLEMNRWGPVKIKAGLLQKGVNRTTVDKVLAELTENLELKEICVDLVLERRRRFTKESDRYRQKKKICAYLQQKGFTWTTIQQALPEITGRLKRSNG